MVYLETANLRQRAVLWIAGTTFTDQGRLKVTSSTEIKCRWREKRGEAINENGEPIGYDATVTVKQDVAVGSILWLGRKRNWTTSSEDMFKVVVFNKIPNMKATRNRRTLLLQRYSDTLPPIES